MSSGLWMLFLLMGIAWAILVVRTISVAHADPRGSVGLTAAVLMTMSFLYGGAFVYAVPGYDHLRQDTHWYLIRLEFSAEMVFWATVLSLLALLGFAIGAGAFRRRRTRIAPPPPLPPVALRRATLQVMLTVGVLSFIGHYLQLSFPLSDALLETGRNILVVALLMGAYFAARAGKSVMPWVVLSLLVPVYYFTVWGFVSFGFMFGMALLGFWLAQLRPRNSSLGGPRLVLGTVAMIYVLLTLFVAWFSFRDEVRNVVWMGDEGSLAAILLRALSETEFFSPWNFEALDLINIRLNLGIFIGRMMERHEIYPELRQYGATLVILPLVLVPRFLWSGKPERGGNEFMAEHTGLSFNGDTTFGTGPIFEFYVNFGMLGVFFGFMALGWIISWIDRKAARHLSKGQYLDFALFYAVGIVAINPLLRPFFIVNGAIFALILMGLFKFTLRHWLRAPRRGSE